MGTIQFLQNRYAGMQQCMNRNFERYTITILCLYSLCLDFRPSQSYVVDYTLTENVNITMTTFHNKILPVRTYAYVIFLLPCMLLIDFVKYKAGIVMSAFALIMAYAANIREATVGSFQVVEVFFGLSSALRIALLTYSFAAFPQPYYRKLTGYIRGYLLIGRLFSAALAQVLISTNSASFLTLNIISLTSVCISFTLSLFLPPTPTKSVVVSNVGIIPVSTPNVAASTPTQESMRRELSRTSDGFEYDENPFNDYGTDPSDPVDIDLGIQIDPDNVLQLEENYSQTNPEQMNNNMKFTAIPDELIEPMDISENIWFETGEASGFTEIDSLDDDNDVNLQSVQNGTAVLELNADILNDASGDTNESGADNLRTHDFTDRTRTNPCWLCMKRNFMPIFQDISRCYVDFYILKLSIWWMISTCVYLQVLSYAPVQWDYITGPDDNQTIKKGAVQATSYLLGCLAAFFCAFWQWQWKIFNDLMISSVALTTATLFIMSSQIHNIWLAYIAYITFTSLYYMTITIASFEIASQLTTEKYALIFGNNFFLGALMHCILMVSFVVVPESSAQVTDTLFLVNGLFLLLFGLAMCYVIGKDIYRQGIGTYVSSIKQLRYEGVQDGHI